jgi:hypothetical protein
LILLLQAEGLRNLVEVNSRWGPFAVPRRVAVGLYQFLESDGHPTGAADLRVRWQYDDAAQAENGREMVTYLREQCRMLIQARFGAHRGLDGLLMGAMAGLVGIDVGALQSALDALQARTEGDQLVIHAALNSGQVRAVLNVLSLSIR